MNKPKYPRYPGLELGVFPLDRTLFVEVISNAIGPWNAGNVMFEKEIFVRAGMFSRASRKSSEVSNPLRAQQFCKQHEF